MPKVVKLRPRYTTPIQPPPQGDITFAALRHTQFGATPSDSDKDFLYGTPPSRYVVQMSGDGNSILSRNPNGIFMPYALHWSTIADIAGTGSFNTTWRARAESWASANGFNAEDIFLHAASGQKNKVAVLSTLAADGTITLGLSGARQITNSIFNIGDQLIVSGTASGLPDTVVTVTGKVSNKQLIVSNWTTATTGGQIFVFGNGTPTQSNRYWFFIWDNWRNALNPGTAAGRAWMIYKHGQSLNNFAQGVFYDEYGVSLLKVISLEYSNTTDYVNDIIALFQATRAAYPNTRVVINTASYTTALDGQMADAAGSCHSEGLLNPFGYDPDNHVPWTQARLAAGTFVELICACAFDNTSPQARVTGLPTNLRNAGGHLYADYSQRAMFVNWAAYLMTVDTDTQPLPRVYFDPANQFFDTNIQAKWYPFFEHNLGRALGPTITVVNNANVAADGGAVKLYQREFSLDGTTTHALMLYYRKRFGAEPKPYDATTQYVATLKAPPAGTHWMLLNADGSLGPQYAGSVPLWACEAAFLIAVPL